MTKIFAPVYADAYDLLYRDKDYAGECDMIDCLFRRYGGSTVSSVLDLGCGTGNHAFLMASRGHEVVGVDRSDSMLAQAKEKLARTRNNGRGLFQQGDIRNVELGRQFDAALMMFAVLGYQLENADVLSALKTARRHLRVGGLLTFDVWYGPAVLPQRPSQRIKVVPTEEGRILRIASGEIDVPHHICTVRYHLWRLAGDRLLSETEEVHRMRYFFPMELKLFLECSGFTSVRLGAFPEFDKDPDETTWNVLGVARAV